jgi:hypothetical protein
MKVGQPKKPFALDGLIPAVLNSIPVLMGSPPRNSILRPASVEKNPAPLGGVVSYCSLPLHRFSLQSLISEEVPNLLKVFH